MSKEPCKFTRYPMQGHAGGMNKELCKDIQNRSEALSMLLVLLYDAVFQILKKKNQLPMTKIDLKK